MSSNHLIDAEHLPEKHDLSLLIDVCKAGAFALDITADNADGIARLKAKGLVNEPNHAKGRVFCTRRGDCAVLALTGSIPAEEQPADMTPFLLGAP